MLFSSDFAANFCIRHCSIKDVVLDCCLLLLSPKVLTRDVTLLAETAFLFYLFNLHFRCISVVSEAMRLLSELNC